MLQPMNTVMLAYKNANLTPEARWLLMQWLSKFGTDHSFDGTLKTLFKNLGMTYVQGRRAWNTLISNPEENQRKFIEIEHLPAKGRGRPRSRYKLAPKFLSTLDISSCVSEHHTKEIAELAKTTLLSAEKSPDDLVDKGRQRSYKLTLPNRWLLMILLAHTYIPGVVTCLGISKIRQLTGLSRARIDRQLKKLIGLGIIKLHQPGRYSSKANERRTSIYLLDIAHPVFNSITKCSLNIQCIHPNKKARKTELVGGILDAAMALAICNFQIQELLSGNDTIVNLDDPKLIKKWTRSCPAFSRNEIIERTKNNAFSLLPSRRSWMLGLDEFFNNYNANDANWMLTNIHIDACLFLSSYWSSLSEGKLGPEQPCCDIITKTAQRLGLNKNQIISMHVSTGKKHNADKNSQISCCEKNQEIIHFSTQKSIYHPLAVFSYALSYHLARQLQMILFKAQQREGDAITYMLTPSNTSHISQHPFYELRGYNESESESEKTLELEFYMYPIEQDLNSYWRTHYQKYFSNINTKSDNSTPGPS